MRTFKHIACKPLAKHAVAAVPTTSGFLVSEAHVSLVPTEVVAYGPFDAEPGHTVYVHGTKVKTPWATQVYKLAGLECILVPVDEVVAMDRNTKPKPIPDRAPSMADVPGC